MNMSALARDKLGTFLLASALAGSLTLNCVQASWLRAAGSAVERPQMASPGKRLVGLTLPAVDALRMTGAPVRLDFQLSPMSVIYLLTPTCGWCRRNYDNVLALARSVPLGGRMIGLAHSADLEAVRAHLVKEPTAVRCVLDRGQ
jgi:hypothetical protein